MYGGGQAWRGKVSFREAEAGRGEVGTGGPRRGPYSAARTAGRIRSQRGSNVPGTG